LHRRGAVYNVVQRMDANLYLASCIHYNTPAAAAAFFNQRGIIRNEQY
jgi:hypothetical protein